MIFSCYLLPPVFLFVRLASRWTRCYLIIRKLVVIMRLQRCYEMGIPTLCTTEPRGSTYYQGCLFFHRSLMARMVNIIVMIQMITAVLLINIFMLLVCYSILLYQCYQNIFEGSVLSFL